MNEVVCRPHESLDRVSEVARQLLHPGTVRSGVKPDDLDAASLQLGDEAREVPLEARQGEYLDREPIDVRNPAAL